MNLKFFYFPTFSKYLQNCLVKSVLNLPDRTTLYLYALYVLPYIYNHAYPWYWQSEKEIR